MQSKWHSDRKKSGLHTQVLLNYMNCLWAEHETSQSMRRLSYEANGSHSGFSDIRVYSVNEELIACYNHALSAASGCSLLLRIDELEYQMVLDMVSILCNYMRNYSGVGRAPATTVASAYGIFFADPQNQPARVVTFNRFLATTMIRRSLYERS